MLELINNRNIIIYNKTFKVYKKAAPLNFKFNKIINILGDIIKEVKYKFYKSKVRAAVVKTII